MDDFNENFTNFDHDFVFLDPIYSEQNNRNYKALHDKLMKEHSWQKLIFLTNPIRIDNITLSNNPEVCQELAKSISFYNKNLIRLIDYRINEGDYYDQEKWNNGLEKLKTLLYIQIKEIIEFMPNSKITQEAIDYIERCISTNTPIDKEYIKGFKIPSNILSNFIYNTKRALKK